MLKRIQVLIVILAGVAILPSYTHAQAGCINYTPAASAFPITYSENGVTTQSTSESGPFVVAQGSYIVSVPDPVSFVGAFGLNSATVFQSCNGAFTPVSGQWVVSPTSTDFWTYTWTATLSASGLLIFTESGVSNTRPLGSYGSDVVNSYRGTVNATWTFNLVTGAYNFTQTDSQTVDFIRGDGVPAINSEVGSGGTSGVVPTLLPVNVQFSGTFSYCTTCIQTNPPQTGAAVVGNPGDVWNDFATNSASGMPLVDITGATTGVTLSFSADGAYTADPSKTAFTGTPYANLMQGVLYSAATTTITLSGLNPNQNYTLYVYTQGDKNSLNRSISISANGGPPQIATQSNAHTFILNNNYVVVPVTADGSGTITIKGVTLADEGDINGLQLVPQSSTSSPITSSLIDPVAVPGAVTGIVNFVPALAITANAITGVSADSVTQVVLRINGANIGDSVQLTLVNDTGAATPVDRAGSGYLFAFAGQESAGSASASNEGNGSITVVAQSTGGGAASAFALYAVPIDFARVGNTADPGLSQRFVTVQIKDLTTGSATTQTIRIVRPPVVLIHGIWGDFTDWLGANRKNGLLLTLRTSGLFDISFGNYDGQVAITASTPDYGLLATYPIVTKGNNLGFKYGATTVLPQIQQAIQAYKNSANVAAVQADIVAHSMGGDVTRTLPQVPGYLDQYNYAFGYVHKLITIGTPHQGSPLAIQLPLAANTCVRTLFQLWGRYAFVTATENGSSTPISGGVGDLQPGSAATSAIHNGNAVIPTAMIGAQLSSSQLSTLGSGAGSIFTFLCGAPSYPNPLNPIAPSNPFGPSDPLALLFTPQAWLGFLGPSDGVVPVTSEFDDEQPAYSQKLLGLLGQSALPTAVHSSGTELLGFGPPSELDQASGVPAAVLQLLNTPVSNSVFEMKP